ncbi:MAG: 3D domain-containing protein [Acutalibacteraceae bacterium]|nr:3D domain-containing protein [Acutalibacteraceae bacterium]
MLEKLKYRLSKSLLSKQARISCVAVMTAVTIAAITLLGLALNTVEIFDGEQTYTVRSLNVSVANVLSNLNLKSERYKITKTTVDNRRTTVEIAYAFPVYITRGDETKEIEFTGGTVADALRAAGYEPDSHDFIEPAADTVITETVYIDYTDIEYVSGSYTEAIPYSTKTVYSSSTAEGTTTLKEGTDGVKQVDYTEKLVNGVSEEKTVTGEEVITAAVNAEKIVGTKKAETAVKTSATVKSVSKLTPSSPIELDSNGNPVNYKSKITARATAYTYTGNNCSTGVAPKPGYIAVNPDYIPYGTKMYIKTADGSVIYGYAVAADTGGFIKKYPKGVDLFMSSESACRSFGVRNVEIYILE